MQMGGTLAKALGIWFDNQKRTVIKKSRNKKYVMDSDEQEEEEDLDKNKPVEKTQKQLLL